MATRVEIQNLPTDEGAPKTSGHKPAEQHVRNPFIRAAGILGLIAILLLGAWGIITIALYLPTAFSNIGGAFTAPFSGGTSQNATTSMERLTVSATSATSGMPFTLSWNHTGTTGNYSYKISYACTTGISIDAPLPTGSFEKVACDTPFNYTNAQTSLPLVPHLTGNASVSVPFYVTAILLSSDKQTANNSVAVSIAPAKTSAPTSSASSGGSTKGVSAQKYYGPADLSVQIIYGNAVGAQFRISNIGGTTVPAGWTFSATLPSGYNYISPAQAAVTAGSGIMNTLNWNNYTAGGYQNCIQPQYQTYPYTYGNSNCGNNYGNGLFSVTVDPQGFTYDANRGNNSASARIY